MRIKMVPGNLYLFWGYRSVHTNEPCDPASIRATALFHYANPHQPLSDRGAMDERRFAFDGRSHLVDF